MDIAVNPGETAPQPVEKIMRIFISYNRQNGAFVSFMVQKLKGNAVVSNEVFFDQENLEGGQQWIDEIQTALTNSDVCIIFIGEQGIGSWQGKEVFAALSKYAEKKGEFKVIPVIIPHSNRELVQKNFPWFLADMQWIEFASETDPEAFQKLHDRLFKGEARLPLINRDTNPYKGLDFFNVQDAPLFFGRTFDTNWVFYKKLLLQSKTSSRFLAIVGDSGSGKSSFARAGILAELQAGRITGSENWKQLIITPEDNPLLKLSSALQSAGIIADAKKLEDDAKADNSALRRTMEIYGNRIILLADQFEEVVTQCKDQSIKDAFLNNITEALKSQHFVCIVTMRSDFYAAFSPFTAFADMLQANNYTITSFDYNTAGTEWERYLRSIIQKPAYLLGVRISPGLTARIIQDCKGISGVLPVLQLALSRLYQVKRDDSASIQSSQYDTLTNNKGIAGIIETHANSSWNRLTGDGSDKRADSLIKAIFIRLVEITGNREDVRKTVHKAELLEDLSLLFKKDEVENMLGTLSGPEVRLIRIKQDDAAVNGYWVEVIHEVLIRQWEMFRKWLEERREAIREKDRLEEDIAEQSLLTGKRLAAAEKWISENKDLTTPEINLLAGKSRQMINRKKYAFAGGLAIALLLALAVWLYQPYLQCKNCAMVKTFKEGNYDVDDVHTLRLPGTGNIRCLRCFSSLDSLAVQPETDGEYLSQATLNSLPQGLTYLSISGFTRCDTLLNFDVFSKLKMLGIVNLKGLRKLSISGLDSLSELRLSGLDNFKTLAGIQELKNLHTLTLSNLYNLYSLAGIEKVTSLRTLTLSTLSIPALDGIGSLTSLQAFSMSGLPNVHSIQAIEKLKESLQLLSIESHIDNLAGVEQLTNLHTLSLAQLKHLPGLAALENLDDLQTLTLSDISIPSLAAIAKLKNLRTLTLLSVSADSLEAITQLGRLQTLSLSDIHITSLAALKELNLRSLSLSNIPDLSSLAGIEGLKNLQTLTVDYLDVSDLAGIEALNDLRTLSVTTLALRNLTAMKNLDSLQTLRLSDVGLSDLAGIEKIKSLHTFGLSHLAEINLAAIGNCKGLQSLALSNLPYTSLAGIANLKSLRVLYLDSIGQSDNQALSIPVLKEMTGIDTLMMRGIKLENLNFMDDKLSINNVVYDDLELGDKAKKIAAKAAVMKQTKFIYKPYFSL